jgi:hypothetical protein
MNIGKIEYLYQLNKMVYNHHRIRIFFESLQVERIMKNLEVLIEDIIPEDKFEDIHIGTFFTDFGGDRVLMPYWTLNENLTLIVYPKRGKIKEYKLNKKSKFLTDAHQNPDPIVIKAILEAVCLHPTITEEYIWLPGCNIGKSNKIGGALLYKTNPFEPITKYPGFEEFINPPKD